jgi:formate C-acetyltransferase
MGFGHPHFENADVIVPAFLTRHTGGPQVTMEDARGFTSCGCQEPMTVGNEGLKLGGSVNAAKALELALNDGMSRLDRRRIGLQTGDPRQFESFEEVRDAYLKQLAEMTRQCAVRSNIDELNLAENHPTVFHSALIEDCIERGMSREEGGARYNAGPGLFAVGLPDVADSFAAMKQLVFEEKRITMAELCDALESDFEGHEDIRNLLLKAPKYGNDDNYVDEQMVWLAREWAAEVRKQRNTRGGHGVPGIQGYINYVPFGKELGALPSGRAAGERLSDGISPCTSNDVNGPTAVLKSVSKVNNFEQGITETLNMSLDPSTFNTSVGVRRLADLIWTLVDQKVMHVTFNVVSPDTLRAAQKEPDKYRNLIVRVAGYCAFFVHLTEGLQNGIIARTDHRM